MKYFCMRYLAAFRSWAFVLSFIMAFDSVGGSEEGRKNKWARQIEGQVHFPIKLQKNAPNIKLAPNILHFLF